LRKAKNALKKPNPSTTLKPASLLRRSKRLEKTPSPFKKRTPTKKRKTPTPMESPESQAPSTAILEILQRSSNKKLQLSSKGKKALASMARELQPQFDQAGSNDDDNNDENGRDDELDENSGNSENEEEGDNDGDDDGDDDGEDEGDNDDSDEGDPNDSELSGSDNEDASDEEKNEPTHGLHNLATAMMQTEKFKLALKRLPVLKTSTDIWRIAEYAYECHSTQDDMGWKGAVRSLADNDRTKMVFSQRAEWYKNPGTAPNQAWSTAISESLKKVARANDLNLIEELEHHFVNCRLRDGDE
jgi:hypothetical protein